MQLRLLWWFGAFFHNKLHIDASDCHHSMVSHSAGIWAGLQCSALFLGDTGWWSGPPLDAAVKGSRARRCYFFWSSPMYCIVRHWWVWFYVLQAIVPYEYTRWYPSPAYSYGPVLGTSTEVHTCGRWPHIFPQVTLTSRFRRSWLGIRDQGIYPTLLLLLVTFESISWDSLGGITPSLLSSVLFNSTPDTVEGTRDHGPSAVIQSLENHTGEVVV